MNTALPASVCVRVTRYCNAHCGFCLAPPDGIHPPFDVLSARLDWIVARGVRTVHFCGGEPTIHPALAALLAHTRALGATPKLTTNGIALPDELLAAIVATRTATKLSIHGDAARHDDLVGRRAYDHALANLRRLVGTRAATALQTTLVARSDGVVAGMLALAAAERVRQINFLPFVARGYGRATRERYALPDAERRSLKAEVKAARRAHAGHIDVRWLDFATRAVPVVEVDGRIVLEGASETHDRDLCRIPERQLPAKRVPAAPATPRAHP